MLATRLPRLLKASDSAKLIRLYMCSNHGHSNLILNKIHSPRYLSFLSKSTVTKLFKGQNWANEENNQNDKTSTFDNTEVDNSTNRKSYSENDFALNVLINSKTRPETLATPLEAKKKLSVDELERILTENWDNVDSREILLAFEHLASHAKLTDMKFEPKLHKDIFDALSKNLSNLNDEELCHLFKCLWLWNNIPLQSSEYTILWTELDKECLKRLPNWKSERLLLICDYWYRIKLLKRIKFSMKAVVKLGSKPARLTSSTYLHFLFVINTFRKPPINMYEVEYSLTNKIDGYTANELGVIAMGFFKSQTRLRDQELMHKMLIKLTEEIDVAHDIAISAIMKISRYSTDLKGMQIFENLLKKIIARVPNLSIFCLTNIAHAAANIQIYDAELMESIIQKFAASMNQARIKDIERLSWVLSIFDYDSKSAIYRQMIDSVRDPIRSTELSTYPTIVPTMLSHLSFANIFPKDLIAQHLDQNFLRQVYRDNPYKIGYNYFALENNIKLDMPEYDGPFLEPRVREYLSKHFAVYPYTHTDKIRPSDQFTVEVAHMCKLALGSDTAIIIDQVLPQYVKPDIIICFDEANNPINPEPLLSKIPKGTIKYPPPEASNYKLFAVVLATQNQIIRYTKRYVGPFKCKIRQLEKIGYTPIVINYFEWRNLEKLEGKKDYIKNQLLPADNRNVSKVAL